MSITLLPRNLASLADLSASESFRYALTGVHVRETPEGGYRAEASDGVYAGIVTGTVPEDVRADFPPLPALATALNSESDGIIPSDSFRAAFKGLAKNARVRQRPALGHVACVWGKDVATLATFDGEGSAVSTPPRVAGRFPDFSTVLPQDPPITTVRVDAKRLAELLTVAVRFADVGCCGVTLEIREGKANLIVRSSNSDGQEFLGILVQLADK